MSDLNIADELEKERLLNAVIVCAFLSALVAITQYFNFYSINELYVRTIAPTQYRSLVDGYPSPRVIGITANPNYYALFAGVAGVISFRKFLDDKKYLYLIATGFFFIIVNMTKSRSGFIFFGLAILCLFIIRSWRKIRVSLADMNRPEIRREIYQILVRITVVILLLAAFVRFGPESLTWRLKHGMDILNDASFMTRVRRWVKYYRQFDLPNFFGVGPTKSISMSFQVDNEWLILLKEFGVIGIFYIILLFIVPMIRCNSYYKDIYFAVISAGAVFMMTSVFINIHQFMPLVMVLAALTQPSRSQRQEEQYNAHTVHH